MLKIITIQITTQKTEVKEGDELSTWPLIPLICVTKSKMRH